LSADGNTAIVGGPYDRSIGAAWFFTRHDSAWTQHGSKLVGSGAVENARQGASVALSADGNTAIVGGPYDNSFIGAAWVYKGSGGQWTQQGSKLVGSGAVESARQGTSAALSADGSTAIVGAVGDNWHTGAAWVFTRNGSVWTQQGSKLVGTGAIGNASQGASVALSADGNTAVVGGPRDNLYAGAAWVFTRNADVWTQQAVNWSAPARLDKHDKVPRSRYQPTAKLPSWAGFRTTCLGGRPGCTAAGARSGARSTEDFKTVGHSAAPQ
jgi:hypothetical protein